MESDVDVVLSHRFDNGADFWAGPGPKIYVGNPFSTVGSLLILHELEVDEEHEAVAGALDLVLSACREDGRIRLGPKTPMYPCYSAEAARAAARFGLAEHPSLRNTADYFAAQIHEDGGWRCSFSRFGRGPETECSNPGATLNALDFLRHYPEYRVGNPVADGAVETLLAHWTTRAPAGPCHWGIGTKFLQVEYPFLRYNIFYFVYVLSFFPVAASDPRFREAYGELCAKVDADGSLVSENPHRRLGRLELCRRGRPSEAASRRLAEIRERIASNDAR
ncbi:MAG: prenyltransferase [Gemmatimonadetes bacterium]|nr:prenyltransferase [Gemmatimonadota bacterium]